MKTNYLLGLRMLLRGHKYLAVSFYRTVMAHKALTAFFVSLLLNIGLFFSLIEARTERDKINHHATMGDYSVDFREIKYDIDNNIDADEYVKFYDYCLEVTAFNLTAPNYESWCKGCPRIPQEVIDKIQGLHMELNTLIRETKEKY